MKIQPEHCEKLRAAVVPLDTPERRLRYKGLSSERYRWDLTYDAKLSYWFCDVLYKYLSDSHINTALIKIVPELT